MALPLLEVTPKTQNFRVPGYELPTEETPTPYRLLPTSSAAALEEILWAAYRQVFGEHLILEHYRQPGLESLLRSRSISVRQFIQGLGKSEVYRQLVAETNSNYRLVDLTFKRFLGRSTYSKQEQITWSIVIATQGLHGFIEAVIASEEYEVNFGDHIVPYQRRRREGRPFNLTNPRYDTYWYLRQLELQGMTAYTVAQYGSQSKSRPAVRQAIPSDLLAMAQQVLPPQIDWQRHVARSLATKVPAAPDSSATAKPTIKPAPVAVPYRYLPSQPRG